jgi:hypothetical protein
MEHTIRNIENAVWLYTGEYCNNVQVQRYRDVSFPGTFAIRATFGNGDVVDFLLVGYRDSMQPGQVADELEEVYFNSWPPKSNPRYSHE